MENENMNLIDENENIVEEIAVEEAAVEEVPAEEAYVEEALVEDVAIEDEVVEEVAEETASEKLTRKCNEVKQACCDTIDRIARDLKETDYNPYFRQTRTYKLEVFRNANEEEPIDVYETKDVKCFSARALVVAGTAAMLLTYATKCMVKKILK